jgi:hypothetical protein
VPRRSVASFYTRPSQVQIVVGVAPPYLFPVVPLHILPFSFFLSRLSLTQVPGALCYCRPWHPSRPPSKLAARAHHLLFHCRAHKLEQGRRRLRALISRRDRPLQPTHGRPVYRLGLHLNLVVDVWWRRRCCWCCRAQLPAMGAVEPGIRRLQVAVAAELLVVVTVAKMQYPRCCYKRSTAVLSTASRDATVGSWRCCQGKGSVTASGATNRRTSMLQAVVTGASNDGRRSCDRWTTVLQASVAGAAEDVSDGIDGAATSRR